MKHIVVLFKEEEYTQIIWGVGADNKVWRREISRTDHDTGWKEVTNSIKQIAVAFHPHLGHEMSWGIHGGGGLLKNTYQNGSVGSKLDHLVHAAGSHLKQLSDAFDNGHDAIAWGSELRELCI